MHITEFLVNDGLLIAAGLYAVGIFLKRTPFVPDWLIPYILAVMGILAAGFTLKGGFILQNILQGIFAAGTAVLANQIKKQTASLDPGTAFASRSEQAQNRAADSIETQPGEDDQNGMGGT